MKLTQRPHDCHKGDWGRIGIIAGSLPMLGAAVLTAKAALRSGCGLVFLSTVEQACPQLSIAHPEIITLPLANANGHLTEDHVNDIRNARHQYKWDVLAVGPGLGRDPSTTKLVHQILELATREWKIPVVIDADALYNLDLSILQNAPEKSCVLTPHPGEFKRLFHNISNREEAALKAAKQCRQIVLLKGHKTIITDGETIHINSTGNNAMATGGMGDALTGIIASLIGQGLSTFQAAQIGAHLHGLAGDLATQSKSIGLLPSDLIETLPQAIQSLNP